MQTEAPQKGLRPPQTSIRRGESGSIWSIFVRTLFSHVSKSERPNMDFTNIDQEDLDSPRRELSNGGLGVVVTLTVFFENCFFVGSYWTSYPAVNFGWHTH